MLTVRIRSEESATEPSSQLALKLIAIPITHHQPRQFVNGSSRLDHAPEVGAGAGKLCLPDKTDGFACVVVFGAVGIRKTFHRLVQDLLELKFALPDLLFLLRQRYSRKHRMRNCVRADFDQAPCRKLSDFFVRQRAMRLAWRCACP